MSTTDEKSSSSQVTLHEMAIASRPGVLRCGFLDKEGGGMLSRAFPSRRFFILLSMGRLEYYEEKQLRIAKGSDEDLAGAVDLNSWNLAVFVRPPLVDAAGRPGLAIGDILTACDGVALTGGNGLRAALGDRSSAHVLTLLRAKGEVPLRGALVEAVGDVRLRITVSPNEPTDGRPPYLLIAQDTASRDA